MSKTPRMDAAFKELTSTTPRMNWQLDQCYREGCKLERELAAVTEQRDRLAEALRHALRFVRAFDSEHESAMDDKWAIQNQCEKALTSVKGGSDE